MATGQILALLVRERDKFTKAIRASGSDETKRKAEEFWSKGGTAVCRRKALSIAMDETVGGEKEGGSEEVFKGGSDEYLY
jgi:hypothetical protein